MTTNQTELLPQETSDAYLAAGGVSDRHRVMKTARTVSGLRGVLYLLSAGGFFVLAMAGVVLPGLPTTPFLLLTSYFLLHSSPRLNDRLLKSKLFGPILVDWQVKGGVRRDVKAKAISVVLIAIGVSLYVTHFAFGALLLVTGSAGVGIAVILKLPEPRE